MAAESPRARAEERLGRKLSSDVEALWAFAKAEAPDSPRQALAPLGLRLAGVFDAFAEPDAKVCWNTHMRFRFDVPEVCTFVVSEEEPGKHWWFAPPRHATPCRAGANARPRDGRTVSFPTHQMKSQS